MSVSLPHAPAALRRWQTETLQAMEGWRGGPFLISAAPGAGKTRPALELARRLLDSGEVSHVAVLCPTTPLTRQWARAAGRLGVELAPDAESPRPPRDFHGVAVTYARVASDARRWAAAVAPNTLVIADEAHHLGEDLAWGTSFAAVFGRAGRWLLLSGTPFRSDAAAIPGVRYSPEGLAQPDVSYSYADAVRDGVCRPVGFITYDGSLSWRSGEDVIESSFESVLTGREASRRYRTAISTQLPDGLPRILREAHARLLALRGGGHRDAGGLVVAADASHARQVAALLREATGHAPVVVLHTEARAADKLAAFTASREPWIVAVNMVSEGVDIPRLRVGVYATAAKTPLIFRQIVGRFVRTIGGRPPDMSWLYLPADPLLRAHAETVQEELVHVLRRPTEEDEWAPAREPREASSAERREFVPLSADVLPQMTLFGSPAVTPAGAGAGAAAEAAAGRRAPGGARPDPGNARELPAYERRALLRDKRRRLVADLSRRDGRSHREINAWCNQAAGVVNVQRASIAQLERSIELLLRRLDARR